MFLIVFSFLFGLNQTLFAFNIELDPIVIGKGISIEKEFNTLSSKEIGLLSNDSLEELVDNFTQVDLKTRGAYGVQSDLSLRGSTFEDNNIYIEGVRINDPQTGHFNLEIPFTAADLESIKLDPANQSFNFSLKKPESHGGVYRTIFGEHAFFGNLISFNFGLAQTKNRVSFEHKTSSGARQDTDFEIFNLSFDSLWERQDHSLEFIFARSERDFGAANFYTTAFPHQEEHTTQNLLLLKSKNDLTHFSLLSNAYFKRHSDEFILNRHNPQFYINHHTTYVYGLDSKLLFENNTFIGLGIAEDKITSTNLARHRRQRQELSIGYRLEDDEQLILKLGGKETNYDKLGWLEAFDSELGWRFSDKFESKLSITYNWRAPSFTELYYVSASNIGNSNLKVQKNLNFELNNDLSITDKIDFNSSVFLRKQINTIDWAKNTPAAAWVASNVGRVAFFGADNNISIKLGLCLKKINFGYSYLNLDQKNQYLYSKYVFDYVRHKIRSSLQAQIKGVDLNLITIFNKPVSRDTYTTFDLVAKKEIRENLTVFIEGNNIFNTGFDELQDIEGDGRWYKAGFELNF